MPAGEGTTLKKCRERKGKERAVLQEETTPCALYDRCSISELTFHMHPVIPAERSDFCGGDVHEIRGGNAQLVMTKVRSLSKPKNSNLCDKEGHTVC